MTVYREDCTCMSCVNTRIIGLRARIVELEAERDAARESRDNVSAALAEWAPRAEAAEAEVAALRKKAIAIRDVYGVEGLEDHLDHAVEELLAALRSPTEVESGERRVTSSPTTQEDLAL
jgi:hypothetical protein